MTSPTDSKAFGRRVATQRKRLGYSQAEFARKVGRSETWLSQVERGVRQIDRMSVLDKLADALDITVADLAPDTPAATVQPETPTAASDLALTLVSNHALQALVTGPSTVALADIESRATRAWEYTHAARYDDLSELLVDLLPDLDAIERGVGDEDRQRAREIRARVYLASGAALIELGETGAAWVAVDRAATAAEQRGDALLLAECAFRLAITFQSDGRLDLAIRVAETAATALASLSDAGPAATSLAGALQLQLAVAWARRGDADTAYRYLDAARSAGQQVGPGRNDFNTEFGPTNVDLHDVAVAVELGDAGRALRVAERIDARDLSAERQGRLLIDVAVANAQLRRTDAVIAALTDGLSIAPEQVAAHSRARTLIGDLEREQGNDPRVRRMVERITLA